MGITEDLMGLGMPDALASVLSAQTVNAAPTRAVATGLTAAGTTIADALQLTAFVNLVGTTAASTGVKLPSAWPIGQIGFIHNGGANALNVFPPTASIKINGGTDGAAVTTAAAAGALVVRTATNNFQVYVLALES